MSTPAAGPHTRVGVLDGCRTPFTKMGGALAPLSVLDLAVAVAREAIERVEVDPLRVGTLVMGSALGYPSVPYLARETAIALGWHRMSAYSAESACATSARTVVNAAHELLLGESEVAIAGGAESMSNAPVEVRPQVRAALQRAARLPRAEAVESLLELSIADLLPEPPGVAEPYSGKTLGEHAEEIIAEWGIARGAADALAVASHRNAAAAVDSGALPAQIVEVVAGETLVRADGLLRPDTSLEAVAALPAVFDEAHGTVTAANASPLTDGAAAVVLATDAACERLGREPLAWIRSWALTAHDPKLGVLLGPAFALPVAMDRAGLALDALGLVDLHEAFAGQVLANIEALASDEFARGQLGRDRALGRIDPALLNVAGGSIAIGHPFGATGARIITQLAYEMRRRGTRYGALAICAGGTRGAAMVLELAQ